MRKDKICKLPTGVDILTEVLQVGDVGYHGGWEPCILPSPLFSTSETPSTWLWWSRTGLGLRLCLAFS